jgi:uncharacterized membrane protein (UPF0127 family)
LRFAAVVAALALAGCGSSSSPPATRTAEVRVGDGTVRAELAGDQASRERGLAGRERIAEDRGMLFVYPDRAERSYWMKGMRFPIDIVWIDRNRVTGVERNVPVSKRGVPLYRSDRPVDRVLEVGAGWAARNAIRAGDPVVIRKP